MTEHVFLITPRFPSRWLEWSLVAVLWRNLFCYLPVFSKKEEAILQETDDGWEVKVVL